MGSYSEFRIGQYVLESFKSEVFPPLMTVFRESDKRVWRERRPEEAPGATAIDGTDDDDPTEHVEYQCPVSHVKQRLDVMGFSIRRAQDDFMDCKAGQLLRLKEELDDPFDVEELLRRINSLQNATFDSYLRGFREIKQRNLSPYGASFTSERRPTVEGHTAFMLAEEDEGYRFNFPCSDLRFLLRVFLEVCADDEVVVQDLTELVGGGYYDPDQEICNFAINTLTAEYPVNERIILLGEGSSDILMLRRTMKLLYPHLFGYYSFMDFGTANVPGGAGSLVTIIKAFAGSGIANRIVALFDNDTAGLSALRGLDKTVLPHNIRVMNLPAIGLAADYPTIGPSGITRLNVNGLASSIELFFGRDVLAADGAEPVPIQWTGFDQGLRQYQGEILRKSELRSRYLEKLDRCESDSLCVGLYDWTEMHTLLKSIYAAFQ